MRMNLRGLQANLEARGKPGQVDQVGVDPKADSISYQAGEARDRLRRNPARGARRNSSAGSFARASPTISSASRLAAVGRRDRSPSRRTRFVFTALRRPTTAGATLSGFDTKDARSPSGCPRCRSAPARS